MRDCPICKKPLFEENLKDQLIDRCPDCMGIYFDKGELDSILRIVRYYNEVKLDEEDLDMISQPERERRIICPADKIEMEKCQMGDLVFDRCPECEGIWLDGGEISALKLLENHIKANLNLYIRLGN